MRTKLYVAFGIGLLILALTCIGLYKRAKILEAERNRYQNNTSALLTDIKRMQIDSTTHAVDVQTLQLTLEEYKRYRAEDVEKIKRMDVRIKSLQAVARHEIEVQAPFEALVKDTVIIRDTVSRQLQYLQMETPHLKIDASIENNLLKGKITLPVTIHQSIWVEHKRRFLWWRWGVKAVHQTISSDNPHVQIKYSEYIRIGK